MCNTCPLSVQISIQIFAYKSTRLPQTPPCLVMCPFAALQFSSRPFNDLTRSVHPSRTVAKRNPTVYLLSTAAKTPRHCRPHLRSTIRVSIRSRPTIIVMGSGRAASAAPLSKVNSETNLAVQLLLSVSNARQHPPDAASPDSRPPSAASDSSDSTVLLPPKQTARPNRPDGTLFKYTREERLEALQRFREKKRRRQYQKRVRYMVRKRLAETRPRYKGRFSKPPPGESYDDGTPGPPPVDNSAVAVTE